MHEHDDYWFDDKAADRVCEFFPLFLSHVKGELGGTPFYLDDWQTKDIIRPLFGWKRPDGTRKHRVAYIELPRKNTKSTTAAGIGLVGLYTDDEPGAEIYSAATDREQAAIVFDVAKQMVEASPILRRKTKVYKRAIEYKDRIYKVLSADAYSKHGLNAHMIIVDELHAHKNRDLVDVLSTSTGSRRQPVEIYITTAGFDRNSICFEYHDYASKVRDGIVKDDQFLPVIYAAHPDDDWKSEETWKKANPGFDVSIKKEYLERECKKAMEIPAYENTFKRLHLNIWTEQSTRWLPMDMWQGVAGKYKLSELVGQLVWGGLDLSTTTDITALQLIFRDDDGIYRNYSKYFVPEEKARDRQRRDRVPYLDWIRDGHLIATPGNVVDYEIVRQEINKLKDQVGLKKIALDRWNSTQLASQLEGDGLEMIMFGQGFASMNSPMKELLTLVEGERLFHCNDPVTNWMMSNVSAKTDPAGNIKPDKSKSTGRIDGVVALIMALGLAIKDQGDSSIYEKRGLTIL